MADPTPATAAPAPATTQPASTSQVPGRDPENGRFTRDGRGQPAPKAAPATPAPEAPRKLRLPTGDELDEEEAVARLTERTLEGRALQAKLQRLKELEEKAEKWGKDPRQVLSKEERRKLAILEAQEWQAEQEEAHLPPEQKALRARERALREREEKIQAEEQRRQQEAEEAQMTQLRSEAVETVTNAMELSGLPKTPATAKRLLGLMKTAVQNGVALPAEVLARKLRASYDADVQEDLKAIGGPRVLKRFPALVEVLNGLEDVDALKLLGPLGERLRKLALENHGLAPSQQPSNVRQLPPPTPKGAGREDPHEVQRRIEARARGR